MLLAKASGIKPTGNIKLTKNLPIASGIGGGSADAAAVVMANPGTRLGRVALEPDLTGTKKTGRQEAWKPEVQKSGTGRPEVRKTGTLQDKKSGRNEDGEGGGEDGERGGAGGEGGLGGAAI